MRTLSAAAQAQIAQATGNEPVFVIGIKWNRSTTLFYADKDIPGIQGKILQIGNLDDVRDLAGSGSNAQISVTLDDSDGTIKALFNANDIQKVPAAAYQYFEGLNVDLDTFLLFLGRITSPIVWSEGDRKLSFDILTDVETVEVGFSPDEAQFPNVSEKLRDKVWPLCFGHVLHVPAVQSVDRLHGSTSTGFGMLDFTLPYKYWYLEERLAALQNQYNYYIQAINALRSLLGAPPVDPAEFSVYGQLVNTGEAVVNLYFVLSFLNSIENNYISDIKDFQTKKQDHETLTSSVHDQTKALESFSKVLANASKPQDIIDIFQKMTDYYGDLAISIGQPISQVINNAIPGDNAQKQQFFLNPPPDYILTDFEVELSTILIEMHTSLNDATKGMNADLNKGIAQADLFKNFKNYSTDVINFLNMFLTVEQTSVQDKSTDVEISQGFKKIDEVDIYNAEYAYKTIHDINKKIDKLFEDYHKNEKQLAKVERALIDQAQMETKKFVITNAWQFPQDTPMRLEVKDMVVYGSLSENVFTIAEYQPKYSNIKIAPRQDSDVDAFWIVDPTIVLKGMFCVKPFKIGPSDPDFNFENPTNTTRWRIFKVKDQYGQKCIIELVENKERQQRTIPQFNANNGLIDLPATTWQQFVGAHAHTRNETIRILENGLQKYQKEELQQLVQNIQKLNDLKNQAPDQDTKAAIAETLTKDINRFNDVLNSVKFKKESAEKASEKISDHEFQELLKVENLKVQVQYSGIDTTPTQLTDPTKVYYIQGTDITESIAAASKTMLPGWFLFSPEGQELVSNNTVLPLPNGAQISTNYLPESTFWFAEAGSPIIELNNFQDKFVANILPSEIVGVYGKRAVNGVPQLVPLPPEYYFAQGADTSYLPLVVTSVRLTQPLSDYTLGFDSDVYVSMISSVGPNTADIIAWIVLEFTNLAIDLTSFATVAAQLEFYPQNFALFSKEDALKIIEDIAFQNRCACYIKNETVFLLYLAATPVIRDTITFSDIEDGSLEIELSNTEDIVTKMVVNWKADYSISEDNRTTLAYNIPKYGLWLRNFNFNTFNIYSCVLKSATFWLIRYANSWKKVKFRTFLTKLALETFDYITLNFGESFACYGSIPALIEKCDYDSASRAITIQCWIPVRSGEMSEYTFGFPAGLDIFTVWPPSPDIVDGLAGNYANSRVPTNVPFKIDPSQPIGDQLSLRPQDYGGVFPSDASDVAPPSPLQGMALGAGFVRGPDDQNVDLLPEPRVDLDNNGKPDFGWMTQWLSGTPFGGGADPDKKDFKVPDNMQAFVGYIQQVIDGNVGNYIVSRIDGFTINATDIEALTRKDPLEVNQFVMVFPDKVPGRYLLVNINTVPVDVQPNKLGIMLADCASGDSADMEVWDGTADSGSSITVWNWFGTTVTNGTKVMAMWFADAAAWYITAADC